MYQKLDDPRSRSVKYDTLHSFWKTRRVFDSVRRNLGLASPLTHNLLSAKVKAKAGLRIDATCESHLQA